MRCIFPRFSQGPLLCFSSVSNAPKTFPVGGCFSSNARRAKRGITSWHRIPNPSVPASSTTYPLAVSTPLFSIHPWLSNVCAHLPFVQLSQILVCPALSSPPREMLRHVSRGGDRARYLELPYSNDKSRRKASPETKHAAIVGVAGFG
jgi:hypothetical protein